MSSLEESASKSDSVAAVKEETLIRTLARNMLGGIRMWFWPNSTLSVKSFWLMVAVQLICFFFIWIHTPYKVIPTPGEVIIAWERMVTEEKLLYHLIRVSFVANVEAVALATAISLSIAYFSMIPFIRTIAYAISALRFNSLIGIGFLFVLFFSGGHTLKVAVLTFGVGVFLVPALVSEVLNIPEAEKNYFRTLGLNEWRVSWEAMLDRIDVLWDIVRQVAAMGFMMLSMVEGGLVRNEGGIGVLLSNQNHTNMLDAVFAIQATIFLVGLAQDWCLGFMLRFLFPYSVYEKEKRS